MPDNAGTHRFTIRIDDSTYQELQAQAVKRGESLAVVIRRILAKGAQSDNALDSQDILLSLIRKAVSQEMRQTENRLANLSAKTAITSAATENMVTYVLKIMNEPNFRAIRVECRKRGVAFVREPLDQIMIAYGEVSDQGPGDDK